MGCDVHLYAEKKNEQGQYFCDNSILSKDMLDFQAYPIFGWLAGVRNYSQITPVAEVRGIPDDASKLVKKDYNTWSLNAHSASWLSLDELMAVDYDQIVEDRRCSAQLGPNSWTGAATCEPGQGVKMTLRDFLGPWFVDELKSLKVQGVDRLVFWFDN